MESKLSAATIRGLLLVLLTATSMTTIASCASNHSSNNTSNVPILGDLLAQATDNVNSIISSAQGAYNLSLLDSANAARTAIDNVASIYGPNLDKAVTADENNTVNSLNNIITGLKEGSNEVLSNATQDLTALTIQACPLSTCQRPVIRNYSPQDAMTPPGNSTHITINGAFPFARDPNNKPTLTIDKETLQPATDTETELAFDVPSHYFNSPPSGTTPVKYDLNVPYQNGTVFKSLRAGLYHLETTVFPTSPIASMTLKNTTIVQVHRPGVYPVGKPYQHIDSFDCHSHSYPENGQPDPVTIQAPYSLDQSSPPKVNYLENKNPNRAEVDIKDVGPAGFAVLGITRPECTIFGISTGSGDISYNVTYSINVPTPSTTYQDVLKPKGPPSWGGQFIIDNVTPHNWTLSGTTIDGKPYGFSGTSGPGNPYISVVDYNDRIQVSIAPLK